MKLLLAAVNAKYIHSNPAVYSLRAYAKANGCRADIEIAEYTINQTADEILADLYKRAPRMLAFSCYIWNLEMIDKLLADLPKILPGTDLWLGGPEVSYDAAAFLQAHPQVRGVLAGEGEAVFAELAAWYEEGEAPRSPAGEREDAAEEAEREEKREALAGIRGLIWRDPEGGIVQNPPQSLLSMDDLPFLYRDLADFENRILYYESSRGCPFSCSYCLSSIERSTRFRSAGRVKEELQFFLDRKVPQVKFVDRTFNCRRSHAMEIWTYIREHDNGVTNFHFEIAAELLDDGEIALLNTLRPGLVQLEIGVQSTNGVTLKEVGRASDFGRLSRVVRQLQKNHNMHLHLDLIAGLPLEDYKSFVRSFNDVYRLHPQQLQLGFLKVLKGSKMHRCAEEYGLVFRARPPYEVLGTRWISYGELLRLKEVESMLEIYCNSGQFTRTMRRLESEFAHPFAMLDALAEYTAAQTRPDAKISRPDRFRLLRGFIKSRTDDPVYDELLLLDLYLRENSRNRPDWARDRKVHWERILDFYRGEERDPLHLSGCEGRSARQMMHMSHLECFSCDVLGDLQTGEHWVLFDYGRRDPLTGDARAADVTHLVAPPRIYENLT